MSVPAEYLIDTDVFSYLLRGDTRGEPYRPYLAGRQGGVSFQTLAELRRWAIHHGWGAARRSELARQVSLVNVYLVDDELMTAWAEVTARLHQLGRPIATADAWIAATALVLDVPLVTNNRRHFEVVEGLVVVTYATTGG